jgi:hypothetical protein
MGYLFILSGYILALVAFVFMMKNYKTANWLWLGMLVVGLFTGVAPFVAIAYLATMGREGKSRGDKFLSPTAPTKVRYYPDGSYIAYQAEDTKSAPSAAKLAFRIVGGIIAGATIAFGLLIVGVILLFTLAPSVACGGSSKCY